MRISLAILAPHICVLSSLRRPNRQDRPPPPRQFPARKAYGRCRQRPCLGAPDFDNAAGQSAILILFQPQCPWCHAQFREAERFSKAHPGALVLAVSLSGSRRDLISELRSARTSLPAWRSSPALIDALGRPEGTPRTFVISENGEIVAAARGLQSADALLRLIEAPMKP